MAWTPSSSSCSQLSTFLRMEATQVGKHCLQFTLRFWTIHIGWAWVSFIFLLVVPSLGAARWSHLLGTDPQYDVGRVCISVEPIEVVVQLPCAPIRYAREIFVLLALCCLLWMFVTLNWSQTAYQKGSGASSLSIPRTTVWSWSYAPLDLRSNLVKMVVQHVYLR